METSQLISFLRDKSIRLSLDGDNLKISAQKSTLDQETILKIKEHKQSLIGYLKKSKVDSLHQQSIPNIDQATYYDLSHAQKRLWVMNQVESNPLTYNISVVKEFEDKIDVDLLKRAVSKLVSRHEILRTSFHMQEDQPVQKVHELLEGKVISVEDLSKENYNPIKIQELANNELNFSFDLSKNPLFRLKVIHLSNKSMIVFTVHHIIMDGWSMNIFLKELSFLYENPDALEADLPILKIQYKDYSAWQNSLLSKAESGKLQNFWLEKLSGNIPVLDLPTVNPRPKVKSNNGKISHFKLDKELSSSVAKVCSESNTSIFMMLLASVKTLLYHYTRQTDIIVGIPVAGRDHLDLEEQIGFYVNTLPIRTTFNKSDTFENLLQLIKLEVAEAFENQFYPFDKLVEDLNIQLDPSRVPLFDVMMVLQNLPSEEKDEQEGLESTFKQEYATSKFDITFNFSEQKSGINCAIEFSTDLFDDQWIGRMWKHFRNLLISIVGNAGTSLSELPFMEAKEKNQLIPAPDFARIFPISEKTIHELFEEQVLKTPDAIAMINADQQFTYKQLNEQANQLANFLIDNFSLHLESHVGIMLANPELKIIAILSVLKSGCAYIPIDPDYPDLRKKYLLEDSDVLLLLTENGMSVDDYVIPEKRVDIDSDIFVECSIENVTSKATNNNLAYIIYTSGSTGNPKGVMIEHRSFVNMISNQIESFGVNQTDRILQFASISFDASVSEIFMALLSGATLVLFDKSKIYEPKDFIRYLKDKLISVITFPPSYLSLFDPGELSFLRCIISAGEPANKRIAQKLGKMLSYYNAYGPTECSVCTTIHLVGEEIDARPEVSIGKPIRNTAILILNEDYKLVPDGIPGELCISGAGLARGYFGKEQLTAEKFVQSPYCEGERFYKSGDYGRRLPDGNIEIIGRIDNQLKIRGYRVELGEVESAIRSIDGVVETVVVPMDEDKTDLIGYIVFEENTNLSDIESILSTLLPSYMIPGKLISLDNLELNINGKIDKTKLPKIDKHELIKEKTGPRNQTESKLIGILSELTQTDSVSMGDDLFQFGVNSLKIIKLATKINKAFNVEISVNELFQARTVEKISDLIRQKEFTEFEEIEKIEESEYYDISHAQKRLWILDQISESNNAYSIPLAFQINGKVDVAYLKLAFNTLIQRHEILRTNFKDEKGIPKQVVNEYSEDCAAFTYLNYEYSNEKELDKIIKDYILLEFDLERDRLIKACLIRKEESKHILIMAMHHIVSDGWSMEVILKDLTTLYDAFLKKKDNPLKPLRIQYKDFTYWQNKQLDSKVIGNSGSYWRSQFEGDIPQLDFPLDFNRPAVQTFNGDHVGTLLENDTINSLKVVWEQHSATTFMGLLSALEILLFRYTGISDVVIGTPIAGREHADLEDQIGFYVNTLALRIPFEPEDSYRDLIQKVRVKTLEAFANQSYPFDLLLQQLEINRDLSRSPLFDVMITLNSETAESAYIDSGDLEIIPLEANTETSKFDLDFVFNESDSELSLNVNFNSDLFKKSSIERMLNHFQFLLKEMAIKPATAIKSLLMMPVNDLMNEVSLPLTKRSFDYEKTLYGLFEDQVTRTPNATALVYEGNQLSYRKLSELSNQFANFLLFNYSVKPDDLLGVSMRKTEWVIIVILGILKSGGAYVPIDAEVPESRRVLILEDAQTKCLISDLANTSGENVLNINLVMDEIRSYPISKPIVETNHSNLAYVIYTSGSTGKPKGVMIEHSSVVNTIISQAKEYKITVNDRILQLASISFDASVFDIFTAIISGAGLVLLEKELLGDPEKIENFIRKNAVTVALLTPSLLTRLKYADLQHLRCLISGGESVSVGTLSKFSNGRDVFNAYGPTESAITCSVHKFDKNDNEIPIGSPIDNMSMFIMDQFGGVLPKGIPGEICISGPGIARGYIGREDLNKIKFINHPLKSDSRVYKTGDIGKISENGLVMFLGRHDNQIKLRGYRIELDEIMNVITSQKGVINCVVMLNEDQLHDPAIVAYVQKEETTELDQIISNVRELLPSYMIPAFFVPVHKFPETMNGKIDKKSLLAIKLEDTQRDQYLAPQTGFEKALTAIWEKVLGIERVGISDDFFQLGGQSLNAINVVSEIHQQLNISVSLKNIFNNPTIAELACLISGDFSDEEKVIKLNHINEEKINAFMIPPIVGSSTVYKQLAMSMDDTFNCYGLQYRGIENGENYYNDLTELLNEFSDEIVSKAEFREKILIVGYSIGALIAFELTKKIEALGYWVTLILIDKDLNMTNSDQDFQPLLDDEITKWNIDYPGFNISNVVNTASRMLNILRDFKPKGSVKRIIAFEAKENNQPAMMKDWKEYVTEFFDLNYLDGHHYNIIEKRNTNEIKNIIKNSMVQMSESKLK